jgi:hypothetical protein
VKVRGGGEWGEKSRIAEINDRRTAEVNGVN